MLNREQVLAALSCTDDLPKLRGNRNHRSIYETAGPRGHFNLDYATFRGGTTEEVPRAVIDELEHEGFIKRTFPDRPDINSWKLADEKVRRETMTTESLRGSPGPEGEVKMALTIAEKKARYEQSALKQLMDAAEHEICERCYCCDVVSESASCWSCGGFQDEFDDWDGFPPDVCSECGGEGKLYWKECIGRCDENGSHATLTSKPELLGSGPIPSKHATENES